MLTCASAASTAVQVAAVVEARPDAVAVTVSGLTTRSPRGGGDGVDGGHVQVDGVCACARACAGAHARKREAITTITTIPVASRPQRPVRVWVTKFVPK